MTPATEFESLLIAAMMDAAIEGKISQLQTTITPPGQGAKLIRLIVVPEEMDFVRPGPRGPFQRAQ
jgi:hypothetical protein